MPGSQSVIFYGMRVLIEGHKNYLKVWFLMNSQPTFLLLNLFLTQLNGHIINIT